MIHNKQTVLSSNFQLVDGHSLFDYGVGLNDLIQLMVRAPLASPKKADKGVGSGDEGSDKENLQVGHTFQSQCEKKGLLCFRPGSTQPGLYNHRIQFQI